MEIYFYRMKPIEPYPRKPVEFLSYDARMPSIAQRVIDLVEAAIPAVTAEHIGSTAVPGCGGRGVIDLMILYTDADVERILQQLDELGFEWVQRKNELPDEWPKGAGSIRVDGELFRLHIHVQPADHPSVAEKRAFRDRLRRDPHFCEQYMDRKRAILSAGTTDPIAYTSAKADFVAGFTTRKILRLSRTNSEDSDFVALVRLLDADLALRDGDEHAFYAQFNKIAMIKHVIVAYVDGQAAGCGAIKEYAPGTMEVKRMFTRAEYRGQGIASKVLAALEAWAAELSYEKCILETGKKQVEAVRLYEKSGYKVIPNYGQYAEVENSICFEKNIRRLP